MSIESPLPSASSTSSKKRTNKFYLPLSHHGMPKTPISPRGSIRPHRFSNVGSTFSGPASPPMTPMSPTSPPMSAKSFGTFIDSEPSTPAYSPRMGAAWDSSTLMLLSPKSTKSSAPTTPAEPEWEMLSPTQRPKVMPVKARSPLPPTREISSETSLSSHPVMTIQEEPMKENVPPAVTEEETEEEKKKKAEDHQTALTAPLEKLATRMKSMLRRKPVDEKKREKKSEKRRRQYEELDRMEDVHWTEM